MATVRRITPAERIEGDPTQGMVREEAIATDRMWAGLVRTAPGMISGWHRHGESETTVYVLSGLIRLEFGPGGGEAIEGRPGDFVLVPAGLVHRESNPGQEESRVIVIRAGSGPPTTNVDGPEGAGANP